RGESDPAGAGGRAGQTFLDQLPEDTTLWLHDLQAIGDAANERLKRLEEAFARVEEKDKQPTPEKLLATDGELVKATLGFRKVFWGAQLSVVGSQLSGTQAATNNERRTTDNKQ